MEDFRKNHLHPVPGAIYDQGEGCKFTVWAPFIKEIKIHVFSPIQSFYSMTKDESGYFHLFLKEAKPGWRYKYLLNGDYEYPDPASRLQPEGVHGQSEITASEFP